MTTEQHTQAPVDDVTKHSHTPETEPAKDANSELREALRREKEKAAKFRQELMESRLSEIGLQHSEGLGKAIAKEYDGDMTVEALSAYAQEEYSYTGTVETVPPEVETGQRLDQLEGTSSTVTPPPEVDRIEETEARLVEPEADRQVAAESIALKSQKFYTEHYGT